MSYLRGIAVSHDLDELAVALGPRARRDEPLARYTAMRIGGPADLLIVCESVDEVVGAVNLARSFGVPWLLLGGGCNVLVADAGVRGLVIVNRAARIGFDGLAARAEAGALLAVLARESVERGLAGLEWAAGLPGSVGGAVVGNAGAFDGDVAGVLRSAMVLGPDGEIVEQPNEWFEFDYRSSLIKRGAGSLNTACDVTRSDDFSRPVSRATEVATTDVEGMGVTRSDDFSRLVESRATEVATTDVEGMGVTRSDDFSRPVSRATEVATTDVGSGHVILAATFGLRAGDAQALATRVDEILEWRRTRHPAGATMGSTFKNPPGSHAGYLIEQAGLRGYRIGGAQISELHGNFFMNTGSATAADVLALIEHARAEVRRQFGVELELEIELVGRD
jgi:UDP-N-acetylenolpyruvoylglucosamine reductase